MAKKPQPRKCKRCNKTGGCVSFRFYRNGVWARDYFHPKCFKVAVKETVRWLD